MAEIQVRPVFTTDDLQLIHTALTLLANRPISKNPEDEVKARALLQTMDTWKGCQILADVGTGHQTLILKKKKGA